MSSLVPNMIQWLQLAGIAGFAATAVVLAIRMGGLRSDKAQLEKDRAFLAGRVERCQNELVKTIMGHRSEIEVLENELETYRDAFLALPDTAQSRDLVRTLMDGMLWTPVKQADGAGDPDQDE